MNNKGITIVSLILAIIILIIITSVGFKFGTDMVQVAEFENVETNLLLIQGKIKGVADKRAIGEIEESELYGVKQEEGEYSDWYLLTQANLNDMGLKALKEEDNYYVFYGAKNEDEYVDVDVAYGKGIEHEGVTYYKLSEMTDV